MILFINVLQSKKNNILPNYLKTWNFLPIYLRSLKPYDKFMVKYILCCQVFKNDNISIDNKLNIKSLDQDTKGNIVVDNEIEIFTISNLYIQDHFVKNNKIKFIG